MVSDRVLRPTELRALSGRSDAQGACRLAIHVALLAGTGWLVAISGPVTLLPAMLAFGLAQVALFAPAHEATHQTAFASRGANLIVGWLAACPSLLNLHFYTAFHFAHHRHTQIPGQDPELDMEPPNDTGAYVRRILGVPYWRLRLLVIADCWRGDLSRYPYVSQQAAPAIIRSVKAMSVAMVGGSIASALLFGWETPFVYWILPQLLCQPFLRAYVLAEHTGCTYGSQRADQHAHHADQRGGAAVDVEHAVSRRASSVSVDPLPSPSRRTRRDPRQVVLRAAWLSAVEFRYNEKAGESGVTAGG